MGEREDLVGCRSLVEVGGWGHCWMGVRDMVGCSGAV